MKPKCVFCYGELGDGDDPDPPSGLVKHKNVRACIVELRTRIDQWEWNNERSTIRPSDSNR